MRRGQHWTGWMVLYWSGFKSWKTCRRQAWKKEQKENVNSWVDQDTVLLFSQRSLGLNSSGRCPYYHFFFQILSFITWMGIESFPRENINWQVFFSIIISYVILPGDNPIFCTNSKCHSHTWVEFFFFFYKKTRFFHDF